MKKFANLKKKLTLSRETVRAMEDQTLREAIGALPWTDCRVCNTNYTCPTLSCA